MSSTRLSPDRFLSAIPGPKGERSTLVFEHGTLTVKLYAPRGIDPQQPHTRDEAYIVVRGSGTFIHGDRRDPFGPEDFLFAPAGLVHRFENFTDDLLVWVLFYGPEGGEKA
jgi:mannose-6-phosphate isomerase-like protein (cupin superfamily)